MLQRSLLVLANVLFFSVLVPFPVAGQVDSKDSQEKSLSALKKQVEELKENQAKMLLEMEDMKALLRELSARREYPVKPEVPRLFSINVHGEPFRGEGTARVAIMEYSDFACSYCARYVRELYPQIETTYVKTGKVKYFFRDLPEHANASLPAQAARCAGDQGKFWEMHDMLFAAQPALDETNLLAYATSLGLDKQKFSVCLSEGTYAEAIRQSAAGARSMNLHGTPSFITGLISEDGNFLRTTNFFVGIESFEAVKASLDRLLVPGPKQ
jgi:protein-disulfide isomerase